MTLILTGIHVLVCLFLIFVVLLQSAQAADLAGAFGGGGSQTALGMRGATTLLQKATTTAAVVFMLTSLALGMTGRQQSSLIQGLDDGPAATAPVDPASPNPGGADDVSGADDADTSQNGAAQDASDDGVGQSEDAEPEASQQGQQQ